jgi:hypothetical protein
MVLRSRSRHLILSKVELWLAVFVCSTGATSEAEAAVQSFLAQSPITQTLSPRAKNYLHPPHIHSYWWLQVKKPDGHLKFSICRVCRV